MKKILLLLAALIIHTTAAAQTSQQPVRSNLSYSFAELRFVDVDTSGGDGFRLAGSYELDGPWILVGALTALDFNNNVDSTLFEIGGGYVWNYAHAFDLVGTLRLVRAEVDTPGGDADDSGFAFSAGARGLLAPQFEVRGSVNHINLDNSDTYLQLAGDYYFTEQVSAGVSLDFAGDSDSISLGARWFFE
ncbi:MAG: outer membrane beta-barrel protein [Woeseiaceae bacterium]|nr:outer membrane beta-barrel protein [Woeseiaceae bacterium]